MTTEDRVTRLFSVLLKAALNDPNVLAEVDNLLSSSASTASDAAQGDPASGKVNPVLKPVRPKNRRKAAAFDPFAVYEESPAGLTERLYQLDIEMLRDMVAEYGMDPSKLVSKWKSPERIIEHIIGTVESRLRKGDAFRA